MFKVGDKVRIKFNITADDPYCCEDMVLYAGREAVITRTSEGVLYGACYGLDVDEGRSIWNHRLLEPHEDKDLIKVVEEKLKRAIVKSCEEEEYGYYEGAASAYEDILYLLKNRRCFYKSDIQRGE